jgi:hypothetical protein
MRTTSVGTTVVVRSMTLLSQIPPLACIVHILRWILIYALVYMQCIGPLNYAGTVAGAGTGFNGGAGKGGYMLRSIGPQNHYRPLSCHDDDGEYNTFASTNEALEERYAEGDGKDIFEAHLPRSFLTRGSLLLRLDDKDESSNFNMNNCVGMMVYLSYI